MLKPVVLRYYKLVGRSIEPCSVEEWARWVAANDGFPVINHTKVGPWVVSTIFTGLSNNWAETPRVWETALYNSVDNRFTEFRRTGGTIEDAEAQHKDLVKRLGVIHDAERS